MQGAIESFTLTVTLRVVRCGATLLDVVYLAQLLDQVTLKIPTLIRMDPTGWAEKMEPVLDQHFCHRASSLVFSGNGLCIFGKHICYYKYILPSICSRLKYSEVYNQDFMRAEA